MSLQREVQYLREEYPTAKGTREAIAGAAVTAPQQAAPEKFFPPAS